MPNALRLLSLAALLATGTSLAMAAQEGHSVGQESTTGTMTGSQQVPTPATGSAANAANGQYTTNAPATSPTYAYPRTGKTGTGLTAQSTGPAYPGVVGPTGSQQPDATNPGRSSPSGDGQENGSAASGGTGNAGGNSR